MNKTSHPLYNTWRSMKNRCHNPANPSYKWYGAKGVVVCDEWKNDFWMFVHHMGEKPSPQHSLDRVDSDYIYCPENCRWATLAEQNNNTTKVANATGITWIERLNKWKAQIKINNKNKHLGVFETQEEASQAYQQAKQQKLQTI